VQIDPYLSSDRDSIAVDKGRARDGFYIIRKGKEEAKTAHS
jgi:hypothetical protein